MNLTAHMTASEPQRGHTEAGKSRKAWKEAYLPRSGQGAGRQEAGRDGALPRRAATGSWYPCWVRQGQQEGGVTGTWGQLLQEDGLQWWDGGGGGDGHLSPSPAPRPTGTAHLGRKAGGEGRRVD